MLSHYNVLLFCRERRLLEQERHRYASLEERNRERERFRDNEILAKSRSRSRSPMRNGRADSVKSERGYDRRPEEMALKIKEERRESFTREDEHNMMSDRLIHASMMERARMMTPAAYMTNDRVPPHPSLWNPFDKGPMDFQNHRLNFQREMEHSLLNRFPGPSGVPGFGLSPYEQERIREEMILREKRELMERLPVFERERLLYEGKLAALQRPPEHLHPIGHGFPHSISPALHNHVKRSSPSMLPGVPPPLIHSSSGHNSRNHSSPAVNKTKGVSPTDSVGESKRDSNSNSTDPDLHSR